MGQRRRFTPEFKRQAVQLLTAGQRPAAEVARELAIPRNRLYKWQKQVAAHGGVFPGSGRQAEPAAEMARLKRELARVTEERDILEKPPRTLRWSPREIRVHPDSRGNASSHALVRGPRCQSQRVLCLASASH
jgi:transposase